LHQYIIRYRGFELGWMCLYEYCALIVVVRINKEQKKHYGFLSREEIDKLPTLTEKDKELKIRMEEILREHEDDMIAERRKKSQENLDDSKVETELKDHKDDDSISETEDDQNAEEEDKLNDDETDTSSIRSATEKASKKKSGRHTNAVYSFSIHHPQFKTHIQCLKSKISIPEINGRIPRLPRILNEKTTKQQQAVAIFMLTLFKPWCLIQFIPLGGLTWENFLEFIRLLHKSNADSSSRNIYFTIENIMYGLSISAKKNKAFATFRSRGTIPWGLEKQMKEAEKKERKKFTEALKKLIKENKLQDIDVPDDEVYEEALRNAEESAFDMGDEGNEETDHIDDLTEQTVQELYETLVRNNLTSEDKSGKIDTGKEHVIEYNNKATDILKDIYRDLSTVVSKETNTGIVTNTSSILVSLNSFEGTFDDVHAEPEEKKEEEEVEEKKEEKEEEEEKNEDISPLIPTLRGQSYLDALIEKLKLTYSIEGEQIDTVKLIREAPVLDETTLIAGDSTQVSPVELIETGDEDAYGTLDVQDRKQLNTEQEYVCNKLYKLVRNNVDHFINPISTPNIMKPLYMMVHGGPGSGKTTLFKELIRRTEAYITRKRQQYRYMITYQVQHNQILSQELIGCIDRINKVVFGIKQCATTGAAAVVVGNKCVTMHSLHAIPIISSTDKQSARSIISKSDIYRKRKLLNEEIDEYQKSFKGAGCLLLNIDEVCKLQENETHCIDYVPYH